MITNAFIKNFEKDQKHLSNCYIAILKTQKEKTVTTLLTAMLITYNSVFWNDNMLFLFNLICELYFFMYEI